jgi:hypothetical protein
MKRVTITVDEFSLPGLYDYYKEGIEIMEEGGATEEELDGVRQTLA